VSVALPEDPETTANMSESLVVGNYRFDLLVGGSCLIFALRRSIRYKSAVDPYHLYAVASTRTNYISANEAGNARPQLKKVLGSDEAAVKYSEQFLAYLQRRTL